MIYKQKAITIQETNNSDQSNYLSKLAEFAILMYLPEEA